jgi:hypothetical protein
MKYIFLSVVLSMSLCSGFSQKSYCPGSSDEDYNILLLRGLIGFEYTNPAKGYMGDQYFNDWTIGEVTLTNGDVLKNISLRYDKYTDQLLWLRNSDNRIGILSKTGVSDFTLFIEKFRDRKIAYFKKMNITVPVSGLVEAYVQVLVPGELSLFVYRNVNIISTYENKLNDNTLYFLANKGDQYIIRARRRVLLNCPLIQKAEMRTVLRSNSISLMNDEQALIRAIILYNDKRKP